jgi:hypothetical protein
MANILSTISSYLHIITCGLWYDQKQARLEEHRRLRKKTHEILKQHNIDPRLPQDKRLLTEEERLEHGRQVMQRYYYWHGTPPNIGAQTNNNNNDNNRQKDVYEMVRRGEMDPKWVFKHRDW